MHVLLTALCLIAITATLATTIFHHSPLAMWVRSRVPSKVWARIWTYNVYPGSLVPPPSKSFPVLAFMQGDSNLLLQEIRKGRYFYICKATKHSLLVATTGEAQVKLWIPKEAVEVKDPWESTFTFWTLAVPTAILNPIEKPITLREIDDEEVTI